MGLCRCQGPPFETQIRLLDKHLDIVPSKCFQSHREWVFSSLIEFIFVYAFETWPDSKCPSISPIMLLWCFLEKCTSYI